VPAQRLRQLPGFRPVRRVEVVAPGEDLQVEVGKEDPGQPGRHLAKVIRMAKAAEGEEHRLAEGGEPGPVQVVVLEGLHEGLDSGRPLGHPRRRGTRLPRRQDDVGPDLQPHERRHVLLRREGVQLPELPPMLRVGGAPIPVPCPRRLQQGQALQPFRVLGSQRQAPAPPPE